MPAQRQLLAFCAWLEWLAGLALMLAPDPALLFLFRVKPDSAGRMLGPLAGIALVALGMCCWGARTNPGSATLKGIAFYNAGAGLYLLFLAAGGLGFGVVLWGAGVLHLGLAAQFAFSPWSQPARKRREDVTGVQIKNP